MSKKEIEPYLLNKKNMARALGISVQAFDKYGIKPLKKVGRENFYLVSDVVEYKLNTATSTALSKEGLDKLKIETAEENKRLKKEQADNLALKNELLRANSVPAELASFVLSKVAAQIVSILEQIPGKIKRKLPELKSSDIDLVKKEIATCRNIASKCDQYVDDFIDEFITDTANSS